MGEYKFGVTGEQRKALVTAISEILNTPKKYLGTPNYAFQIGDYHIDREGTVTGEFDLTLFAALENRGFDYERSKTFHFITPRGTLLMQKRYDTAEEATAAGYGIYFTHNDHDVYIKPSGNGEHCKHFALVGAPFETPEAEAESPKETALETETPEKTAEPEADSDTICIEYPITGFTPETLENLCRMVTAKEPLIKKALGVDEIPIRVMEDKIAFPWFKADSDNILAYTQLISHLCKTAKEKKRVTAKAHETFENERFAMRVWLIGLGLIGKDFSQIRKIMTTPLSGNGAWRYGKPEELEGVEAEAAAPAPETADNASENETPVDTSPGDEAANVSEDIAENATGETQVDAATDNETPYITDTLFEQIMEVRASGECNMLDTTAVMRYAHNNDLFELVVFIEADRKAYANFILTGERGQNE